MTDNLAIIKRAACVEFGLTTDAIMSTARVSEISSPRHIAIWLCWKMTNHSMDVIGDSWNRYAGSIAFSVHRAEEIMARDPIYRQAAKTLMDQLMNSFGLKLRGQT